MFKKATNLTSGIITIDIKKNLTKILFWGGLIMVFIGAIFGKDIDRLPLIPDGIGEAILKGGSAILGAGVFAVIMKSAQFTELFQQHIYDVFYKPEENEDRDSLLSKWRKITNSLLKDVLPKTHLAAVSKIEQQFFDSELEYHFEDYSASYRISVQSSSVAVVECCIRTSIVLSPCSPEPILKQTVETAGEFELIALRANGVDILKDNQYKKDKDNLDINILRIPLMQHSKNEGNGTKTVQLERVTKWTQNLIDDPYIKADISRYIKGATVRAIVPKDGYKLHFRKYGLGTLPKNHYLIDDGEGYERWTLATAGDLLLPGQGYILAVIPEISIKQES